MFFLLIKDNIVLTENMQLLCKKKRKKSMVYKCKFSQQEQFPQSISGKKNKNLFILIMLPPLPTFGTEDQTRFTKYVHFFITI